MAPSKEKEEETEEEEEKEDEAGLRFRDGWCNEEDSSKNDGVF